MQQLSGGQAVTLLPGILQNFNRMEVPLHTLSITAKLGIAGLLALLIKDAACLQSISAAYENGIKAPPFCGEAAVLEALPPKRAWDSQAIDLVLCHNAVVQTRFVCCRH